MFFRFEEFVSSFLKIDSDHLIAASGEGTIQSFDLRQKKPDIQSEMYDGELTCMGTVRSGTKLVVGSGTGPLYLFRYIFIILLLCCTPVSPSRCPTKLVS